MEMMLWILILPDEALFFQTQLSSLAAPKNHNLRILQGCVTDIHTNDYLLGRESHAWSEPSRIPDLVALIPQANFDPLTQWLVETFLNLYHKVLGKRWKTPSDADANLFLYSDEHIRRPVAALSVSLASVLPVLAILVLHLIKSTGVQLGIIAAFTICFSLSLALMTDAKRIENFAATTA
jgi:hypothetical protein